MDNTEENNLDLLDLDDDTPVETLPETTPFAAPRPRKPWLLMGLGLVVVILATYIIIRTIGSDSSKSVEINLDAPVVATPDSIASPNDTLNVPPKPVPEPVAVKVAPAPQPVVENNGVPVRVVTDRKDVTFNPDKPVAEQPKPVVQPAPKPTVKPAPKPTVKPVVTTSAKWFVQFGSYATRAAAESAEAKIRSGHASLFEGKQFVILAAQLSNGKTTYRLRVGFATSNDANGFCQNAKSDGLDCYVAK